MQFWYKQEDAVLFSYLMIKIWKKVFFLLKKGFCTNCRQFLACWANYLSEEQGGASERQIQTWALFFWAHLSCTETGFAHVLTLCFSREARNVFLHESSLPWRCMFFVRWAQQLVSILKGAYSFSSLFCSCFELLCSHVEISTIGYLWLLAQH